MTAEWTALVARLSAALRPVAEPIGIAFLSRDREAVAPPVDAPKPAPIVAIAKERGDVAVSVGCALSRARTGMKTDEMTCALPARKLGEIVAQLEAAADLDRAMARYASADAKRFR